MTDSRPDPEVLLARLHAEKGHRRRGKLKVFFGAAPGVGKTYSMLEAGRTMAKDGADVVVGYVEPHSRPDTQALVLGLDVLPRREGSHRGMKFLDFDLDAALARRPQVLLLDELAHTNAPGARHSKRWQDVVELLDAGIDVCTTINVQHLESLNDIVAQITRVTVRETVPDSIFDQADDVELVDLAPDDLLERLREGKVYVPREAERAVQHFFTKGNLIALRELALRKAAESVGSQMEDYRKQHSVTGTWAARERLLVCVGPSPFAARLVRATRRMANSLHAPWIAVHVETPADAKLSDADRHRLDQTLQLAEQLGGETAALTGHNLADELVHYARQRNVTKIVAGKPQKPRWREWLSGSLVYELTRKCGDIDVYVISGDAAPASRTSVHTVAVSSPGSGYIWAVSMVAACTAVGLLLSRHLAPTNLVMVYLLGVVAASVRLGRRPSMLASFLSVAAFDFFFVPPSLTFAVQDTEYLITFVVMLLTSVVISTLTDRVRFQAESARRREQRTASLYAISRELAATQTREQIARAAVKHTAGAVGARVAVLVADRDRQLIPLGADIDGFVPSAHDAGVARWALEHGQIAGKGTATLPGSEGLYLPLRTSSGTVGLLCIDVPESRIALIPEQLPLIEAIAGLVALAMERAALAAEAERIRLQAETERLRSSLLSAVSRDLRRPL
jgi:two-component system sensor histidine kinase KdpD